MRIVVITHADDRLIGRIVGDRVESAYMLGPILQALALAGHKLTVSKGVAAAPVDADLAILHVDRTFVPEELTTYAGRYARCLNLRATDISKRAVSGAILGPGEPWSGPVIVKTDLNFQGIRDTPGAARAGGYRIFNSRAEVPDETVRNPDLVIERFLPERTQDGYATRFWTFAGAAERCSRVFSRDPIVKAGNSTGFEFCPVPDALRARRAELGFDYGKFDFVVHDGEAVLIDANTTPGAPPVPEGSSWPQDFAEGILGCLE